MPVLQEPVLPAAYIQLRLLLETSLRAGYVSIVRLMFSTTRSVSRQRTLSQHHIVPMTLNCKH